MAQLKIFKTINEDPPQGLETTSTTAAPIKSALASSQPKDSPKATPKVTFAAPAGESSDDTPAASTSSKGVENFAFIQDDPLEEEETSFSNASTELSLDLEQQSTDSGNYPMEEPPSFDSTQIQMGNHVKFAADPITTISDDDFNDDDFEDVETSKSEIYTPLLAPGESPLDNGLGYEFRITEKDIKLYSVEDCFNDSKRVIKAILAIVLFGVILTCLIVSKGSILFITSQMNQHVSFKRAGFLNETSHPAMPTTASWFVDDDNSTDGTIPCGDDCEQCGVPVCLSEEDTECAQKESVRWIWGMFLCQTVPYFIMFLRCLWKISFKKKKRPSIQLFSTVVVIESLYTIGVFLLLFVQLPHLDAIRGLFLFTGVAFIPAILKMFNRPRTEKKKTLNILLDVFAFLGQASALITWLVISASNENPTSEFTNMESVCNSFPYIPATTEGYTTSADNLTTIAAVESGTMTTTEEPHPSIIYRYAQIGPLPERVTDLMLIPLILILISLGYWENFLDGNTSCLKFLNNFRHQRAQASTKLYFWVSLWKILLTFILIVIQHAISKKINLEMLFKTENFYDNKCSHNDYYYEDKEDLNQRGIFQSDWLDVSVIQISMGIACFYVSDLAIKGQMQRISFTLPMVLATPCIFGLLSWACLDCFNGWDFGTSYYWNCFSGEQNYADYMGNRYAWIGIIWWLSFLALTRYLWYPEHLERLAKLDRVFVYPVPEGPMLEQALSLNRRRNDLEIFDNVKKNKHHEKEDGEFIVIDNPATQFPTSSVDDLTPLKVGHVPTMEGVVNEEVPFIYMCATMWHENEKEMLQMLKSVFRQNLDQCAREKAKSIFDVVPDYYRFETHIFFDDAFESHKPDAKTGFKVNSFVKDFINTINLAASSVMNASYVMDIPTRYETPYGGRLEWTMPIGENKLVMHLKDKQLIRNRKRWSQIMYMHRILGLGIMNQPRSKNLKRRISENTFVLALDGDIDFKPDAVLLLLDLMKRNKGVGAACGRIHPIGNGPMVWYQKFEYSISHWLQKATEHILGCVLCSPGCFSLFRASALMDDNVVQTYTTMPTKPIHHVQYDQGEDRWLCTLLLQQGHRVEYSAAADAYTYAPEGFNEFYNQRRRWITSTFANLLDLLSTGRHTASKNQNISMIYIFYQGLLFAASVLGPATIFMLIIGAFNTAFGIDELLSFFLGITPMVVFMILCYKAPASVQLKYAALLSIIFAILQMLVIVGISQQMNQDGVCAPSSVFFLFVVGSFILCGILHPQEAFNLFHGFLYYLFIPSMYLILIVYSLVNLHVVSWGTRETKPTQTDKEKEENEQKKKQVEEIKKASPLEAMMGLNFLNSKSGSGAKGSMGIDCRPCCLFRCCTHNDGSGENLSVKDRIEMVKTVDEMKQREEQKKLEEQQAQQKAQQEEAAQGENSDKKKPGKPEIQPRKSVSHIIGNFDPELKVEEANLPWIDDPDIPSGPGTKQLLHPDETKFWEIIIKEYLYPLDLTKEQKDKTTQGLKELRNKAVFSFFLIDLLLMVLVLGLTKTGLYIEWNCTVGGEVKSSQLDPIGFAFVFIFGAVLAIQVVGMLIHRLFTFLQIISKTVVCKSKEESKTEKELIALDEEGKNTKGKTNFSDEQIIDLVKQMQRFDVGGEDDDAQSDFGDDDMHMLPGEDEDDDFRKRAIDPVRKMSMKPKILTNEEINRKLAARYIALSNEVFGRRPDDDDDDDFDDDYMDEEPQSSSSRRPSIYVQNMKHMDKDRKKSMQVEIDHWKRRTSISYKEMQQGRNEMRQLIYDKDGKLGGRPTSKWSTTTVQVPTDQRKGSIFAQPSTQHWLSGQRPSDAGHKPTFVGHRPSVSMHRPSYSAQRPSNAGHRPSYSRQRRPSNDGHRPTFAGHRPSVPMHRHYSRQRPSNAGQDPNSATNNMFYFDED